MSRFKQITGQIGLVPLVGIGITLLLSTLGSFAASDVRSVARAEKIAEQVADRKAEIGALDQREAAHFAEVLRSLERIEKKLGTLPVNRQN